MAKSVRQQACLGDDTLYRIFTNNKELFNKGTGNYVSRNVLWEVQTAITMTTAMTELGMDIVQSSDFAGILTGFSSQVVS